MGANKRELLEKRLEKPIYHCLFFTSHPTFSARSHHSPLKPPATEPDIKVWITNSNDDFQIERTLRNQFCILAINYLERRPIDRRENLSRSFHHGAGHMCYFLGVIVTRLR